MSARPSSHRRSPVARRGVVAAALATALLAAGCGSTGTAKTAKTFSGEEASVASTIGAFQSDAQSRDGGKLCKDVLDPALAAKLKDSGGGCSHVVGNQLNTIENYDLTVESVSVTGTTATARVRTISNGKTHFDTLQLTKVGNSWRLSGLGG